MADSSAFDWVCAELENATSLTGLEARGTVRLTLKESGLDAKTITPDQTAVVLQKLLPKELAARGVDDADAVCDRMAKGIVSAGLDSAPASDSPEAVFRRLGS